MAAFVVRAIIAALVAIRKLAASAISVDFRGRLRRRFKKPQDYQSACRPAQLQSTTIRARLAYLAIGRDAKLIASKGLAYVIVTATGMMPPLHRSRLLRITTCEQQSRA